MAYRAQQTRARAPKPLDWDMSWIVPGKLIQGGYPSPPAGAFGICDTLVLTAEEHQPRVVTPNGKRIVQLPLDDDAYRPMPREFQEAAIKVAGQLASEIRAGRVVAVTCAMGVNRSGLLTALTLMHLFRCTARQAIVTVRANRKPTKTDLTPLCNPLFEQMLLAIR